MGTIELNVVAKREPPKPPPDMLKSSSAKSDDKYPPFTPDVLECQEGKVYITRHGYCTMPLKKMASTNMQAFYSDITQELMENAHVIHGYYDKDGRYSGLGLGDKRHLIMEKVEGWETIYAWMCGKTFIYKHKHLLLAPAQYPTYKSVLQIYGSVSKTQKYMFDHLKTFKFKEGQEW